MFSYRICAAVVTIAAGAVVLPIALASKNGAGTGYSGGPDGGGQSCTLCHRFEQGAGRVQLLGAPQRYRSGVVYDLTVRINDSEQKGAGFEISAEGSTGHLGEFLLRDPIRTRYTDNHTTDYVTHTRDGVDDSIANWSAYGGSYEFLLAWQAPLVDAGPITFFTAGQAVDDALALGDHYYADHATIGFARPGDADGDTDVDLLDFAELQRCFSGVGPAAGDECAYLDTDDDGAITLDDLDAWIDLNNGPTATLPAGFVQADAVRGGALYDRWWLVNGASQPTGDHPIYPEAGLQSGSVTFRCKECHGWDYKGSDGAYGSGSHFSGVGGVFGTTRAPQQLYDLLGADPAEVANGHNMDAYGMSERDLWDVVKFTVGGVVDTDDYVAANGAFVGEYFNGSYLFAVVCSACHGEDGKFLNLGTAQVPSYIGTVANSNPWEFLHKVRFGHPGSSMPATDLFGWSAQDAADIGAYSATLPR